MIPTTGCVHPVVLPGELGGSACGGERVALLAPRLVSPRQRYRRSGTEKPAAMLDAVRYALPVSQAAADVGVHRATLRSVGGILERVAARRRRALAERNGGPSTVAWKLSLSRAR